ncbi:MAG: choice-of-anchor D domain-containing protein, partial [Acidimicrobiia bacterium]|nr:choice-of-anchor D domain-containing protein [Acidimicrobiia bacterium]
DTVGIYRNGTGQIFYTNENPWTGIANTANDFFYGVPSDEFIPGDWDGDGVETVGIYRPDETRFYLRNENSTGPADETFTFGQTGWIPLGGDTELREATLTAPSVLDLGAVGLNGTGTATLTVNFNGDSGDADLRITAVEFGQSGFDYSAAPLADPDIGFGQSREIEVSMSPTTLGVKRGFIRIKHTGADSPLVVDLIGRSSYRVNAGGDPIDDWGADSPFSPGGNIGPPPDGSVSGPTAPNEVYESYRFGQQAWDFAVTPGQYRVNLYFAETFVNSAGARLFDVDIEGVEVLNSFDIFAAAGGKNAGIVRGFDVVSDGNLDVDFTEIVNSPAIQGIEVIPMPVWTGIGSTPSEVTYGSIAVGDTLQRTITVVHLGEPSTGSVNVPGASISGADAGQFAIISGAGARTVTPGQTFDVVVEFRPTVAGVFDADLFISHSGSNSPLRVDLSGAADEVILYRLNTGGNAIVGQFSWSPDEAFLVNDPGVTGELVLVEAINTSDQSIPPGSPIDMIRTERFGPPFEALGYDLPVPNGPYEVRLYFVEPVHTAAGVRVFDVRLEGGLAINDLDIFARAGKDKAIMIPVQTNVTGGILDIDLVPIAGKNLPAIHGIEVIKKEGNAFLSADPLSLTLGPIVTTGTATADVEISHDGGAGIPSIVVQSVSITGPGSSRFTLLSGPSAGDVLPPGTSDTAQIRFTPGVIGDKAADLNIQYNGGRVITIPLVGSVNNAPVMVNPGNRSGTEGVAFTVTATASDPDTAGDGDFRTMTASGVPAWASVSAGDGTITISGTPGFTDAGSSVVTLTVTDPDGLTNSKSFTISIANFNRPPTFVDPLVNQTNTEGDTVSVSTEAV